MLGGFAPCGRTLPQASLTERVELASQHGLEVTSAELAALPADAVMTRVDAARLLGSRPRRPARVR